jgi:hypothetical protein
MEPKPLQKSFASRHPILTTILIGVPVVIFIGALADNNGSSNDMAATTTPATQVAATQTNSAPANLIAFKSVNYYRDSLNEPCANGEVANISNETLEFVEADIDFNNSSGNLVEPLQTYLNIESLPPGQTATFEDCASAMSGVVLAESTISFDGNVTGSSLDENIPYEDDTKAAAPATTNASANTTNQPATAPTATPTPSSDPAPTTMQDNWSSYANTSFEDLLNEPGYYLGDKVKIVGMVFDFLGEGGRGGNENYVEIEDPNNPSSPTARIVLQVDSSANYNMATQDLNSVTDVRASGNLPDSVTAYGTVIQSESFSLTGGGFVSVPVIEIARIDKCNDLLPTCELGATSIFPAGLSTPSTAGTTNTNQTSQATSPTPAPSTPSNSRYFQLNVAGACQNDGDGTIILTGYPYANGYNIPPDDITEWSDGAIGFTVPNDMTAGTYQVDIRGYTPGVGTCPDVSGGSITVP